MAKIIIVRHGETIEGVGDVLLGQKDGTLSLNGKKEVKALSEELRNFDIESIISSDLKRASDTAKIVSRELKIGNVYENQTLRERSAGICEGMSTDKIDWESYEESELANRKHEGGESFSDVENRIVPFLNEMWTFEANTLIVTHSVVIHIMIKILDNITLEEALKVNIKDKFLVVDTNLKYLKYV